MPNTVYTAFLCVETNDLAYPPSLSFSGPACMPISIVEVKIDDTVEEKQPF